MVTLLQRGGLKADEGRYSIHVRDCEHFLFQHYGGDISEPTIDADAETLERMLADAALVSRALTVARVKHRLEVYGPDNRLAGYLHHEWPREV
jgi:hypothetical protein